MEGDQAILAGSRPPRVLFYSPAAEFKGGAERSLMDLVAAPGLEAAAVTPGEGAVAAALRGKGVPVRVLPFGIIADIRRPFRLSDGVRAVTALLTRAVGLKRICKAETIQFVHSNGLKAHMVAIAARLLGGAPVVVHIRDIPLTAQEKLVWRILAAAATKLVLVSRACWPWKELPKNAVVIFNGIDLHEGAVPTSSAGPLTLGFFGRIHQAKGLHLLIDWLRTVRSAGVDARLVVRGKFYDEAGNYEDELNAQIRRLGLESAVEFQGFRTDPTTVYDGIDVVCVPSHTPDPLPRAVMEAMALGRPVIAYPAGGILEMIEDGRDGFLVADGDAFVAALHRLQDDGARAAIQHHAMARAKSQFALSRLHESIDRLYRDLSARTSKSGPIIRDGSLGGVSR